MPKTKNPTKREPVVVAAVASLLVWLGLRFGLPIDNELANSIAAVTVAAFTIWARSRVTPVAKVDDQRGESALTIVVAVLAIVVLVLLLARYI